MATRNYFARDYVFDDETQFQADEALRKAGSVEKIKDPHLRGVAASLGETRRRAAHKEKLTVVEDTKVARAEKRKYEKDWRTNNLKAQREREAASKRKSSPYVSTKRGKSTAKRSSYIDSESPRSDGFVRGSEGELIKQSEVGKSDRGENFMEMGGRRITQADLPPERPGYGISAPLTKEREKEVNALKNTLGMVDDWRSSYASDAVDQKAIEVATLLADNNEEVLKRVAKGDLEYTFSPEQARDFDRTYEQIQRVLEDESIPKDRQAQLVLGLQEKALAIAPRPTIKPPPIQFNGHGVDEDFTDYL